MGESASSSCPRKSDAMTQASSASFAHQIWARLSVPHTDSHDGIITPMPCATVHVKVLASQGTWIDPCCVINVWDVNACPVIYQFHPSHAIEVTLKSEHVLVTYEI